MKIYLYRHFIYIYTLDIGFFKFVSKFKIIKLLFVIY